MNEALARASIFIEVKKGEIVSTKDPFYTEKLATFAGHDLRSADLRKFWRALNEKCREEDERPEYCPTRRETEMFEFINRPDAPKSFVIITYALEGPVNWRDVATHEIIHAQYFLDSKFRRTADAFWDAEVDALDKSAIKSALSSAYDDNDDLLMKNEFQAYMLMTGAESAQLSEWVDRYRERLISALADEDRTPLAIEGE